MAEMATQTDSSTAAGQALLQSRVGVVRKDTQAKTIKVEIKRLMLHSKYSKYLRRRTYLQVHDPENKAHVGDTVEIVPCRRMSKTKSWRLLRVLRADAEKGA